MTTTDQAEWDERYAASDRRWSGRPNGALVREVAGLPPGRALDVGCGEGADAIWLAGRGWTVTALDVSRVALDRAAEAGREAGVEVDWLHSGLLDAPLPAGGFDLVSAQYPVLLRTPGHDAERALLAAVAPGGTLLVVHHADRGNGHGHSHGEERGVDPTDLVLPEQLAALLDEQWQVEVDERRPREAPPVPGEHPDDLVLKARRVGADG